MASFEIVSQEELLARQAASHPKLRCLTSELGCLTRQDGSASLSHGDTNALAVAYGPAEVRMNREQIDRATVEVIYKPKVGLPKPADRKKEQIIRNTVETAIETSLHPRSSVTVIVQETEDLGSNLACCINAACLALLDAAVSMKFMVAAVAVAITQDNSICVDPTKEDETDAKAVFTFMFDSKEKNNVAVVTHGSFTQSQYTTCQDAARQVADTIFNFYRESLSKKVIKSV